VDRALEKVRMEFLFESTFWYSWKKIHCFRKLHGSPVPLIGKGLWAGSDASDVRILMAWPPHTIGLTLFSFQAASHLLKLFLLEQLFPLPLLESSFGSLSHSITPRKPGRCPEPVEQFI
jgi:hypothetical protein